MTVSFRVKKRIFFEVEVGGQSYRKNSDEYFSTVANQLNYRRTDYAGGGQAQERLLPKNSAAYEFYKKWDSKHLALISSFSDEEMNNLMVDIDVLKIKYPHIDGNNFNEIVEFDRIRSKTN